MYGIYLNVYVCVVGVVMGTVKHESGLMAHTKTIDEYANKFDEAFHHSQSVTMSMNQVCVYKLYVCMYMCVCLVVCVCVYVCVCV